MPKNSFQDHSNNTISAMGLRPSKRDWNADTKKKELDLNDLSLVSRSDDNSKNSLKNVDLQHDLWDLIKTKIDQVKDEYDKKSWDPIVDQFRKLREGIFASNWSNNDISFSIQVFESSVDCCIKAERYEELSKSLVGLLDTLYVKNKKASKPYYIVLDVIYQCCYVQNIQNAKMRSTQLTRKTHEGSFGKRLVEAMLKQNAILYFKLYHYNPYATFKILMNNHNDAMRKRAISVLRKAYMSTSIGWIGQWLGIYNDNNLVISELERLVQPTCIKSIDHDLQLIYFLKNNRLVKS